MRGEPNAARRPAGGSSRRVVDKGRNNTRRSRNPRAARTARRAPGTSSPRSATPAGVTAATRHGSDPVAVAREIGIEIARALAAGHRPPAKQIESVVLEQIREQVAVANEELERARAALSETQQRAEAAEARAVVAERQAAAWRGIAAALPGIGTVAVAPAKPAAEVNPVVALLRDAAASWKTAPSGSVGASRSALEQTIRTVAERLPNGGGFAAEKFADVIRFLIDNDGAPNNLPRPDLFLARSLYDRSSKAGHGVAGWKATPTEALLMLAGVGTIARRAGIVE